MQNISIAGNVGRDAEIRQAGGSTVCGFSLAVSGYDRRAKQKVTTWYRVSVWGARGERLAPMLTKGSKVALSGELSVSEYEGKTQLEVTAQDVTLLGGKPQDAPAPAPRAAKTAPKDAPAADFPDDDQIPF